MSDKIKVAHVIRVFSYGGAEVLLREFFSSSVFKAAAISDLYVLDHKKLGLLAEVQPHIRKSYYYKITTWRFLFEYLKFLRHLVKNKYDVVHMHLPVAGWLSFPAKFFAPKTKFIYSEHNLVTHYSKYNYYLSGLTYGFFDCLVFVSHEVSEIIKKVQKGWFYKTKKGVTILNGIDTAKFSNAHRSGRTSGRIAVGLVARFRPQKRVDKWVEVAGAVRQLSDEVDFFMVGDGPDDDMLRQKIKELNLENIIRLPGKQSDTVQAYRDMDIFLLTSDFEGLPLALMEAMSSGAVPVISNVGGIKQLDFDGFGYKFDDFDAPTIAGKIVWYQQHQQQMEEESVKARAFIERYYSLNKQVNEVLALYRELLEK